MIAVIGGIVLTWDGDEKLPTVHRKLYTAKPTKGIVG